eukprot:155406-Rhodomonas_salina.7
MYRDTTAYGLPEGAALVPTEVLVLLQAPFFFHISAARLTAFAQKQHAHCNSMRQSEECAGRFTD